MDILTQFYESLAKFMELLVAFFKEEPVFCLVLLGMLTLILILQALFGK